MDLLPKKSEYVLLKLHRQLKERLGLQTDEVDKFQVKFQGENMSWDKTLDTGTDFDFNETEMDIIKKELRALDEKRQLEDKHFTLYKKFIEGDI